MPLNSVTVTPIHVPGPVMGCVPIPTLLTGRFGPVPVILKLASPALMVTCKSSPTQVALATKGVVAEQVILPKLIDWRSPRRSVTMTFVHDPAPVRVMVVAVLLVMGKPGPVPVISKLASPALMVNSALSALQANADTFKLIGAVPMQPSATTAVFPPLSVNTAKLTQVLFP